MPVRRYEEELAGRQQGGSQSTTQFLPQSTTQFLPQPTTQFLPQPRTQVTPSRQPSFLSPVNKIAGEFTKGLAGSGVETFGGLGGLAAKVIPGKKDDEFFQRIREKGASMRGSSGAARLGGFIGDVGSIALGGAGIAARATKLPSYIQAPGKLKRIKAITPYLPEAAASTALTGLQQQDQIKSGELSSQFVGEIITSAAAARGLKFLANNYNKYKAAKQIPTEDFQIPSGTPQTTMGSQLPSGTPQTTMGSQLPSGTPQLPSGTQQVPSGTQQVPSGTQQATEGLQYIPDKVLQQKVQPIAKELKESTFLTPDAPFIRLIANAKPETRKALGNKENIDLIKNLPNNANLANKLRSNIYSPLILDPIKSTFEEGAKAGQVIGKYKDVIKTNKEVQQSLRNYLSSNMDKIVKQFGGTLSKDGKVTGEFSLINEKIIKKITSLPTASPDDLQNSITYFSKIAGQELRKGNIPGYSKINQFKKALQEALASGLDTQQKAEFLKANEIYSKYKDAQPSIFSLLKLNKAERSKLIRQIELDDDKNFNQKIAETLRRASNINTAKMFDSLETINESATTKIDIPTLKNTVDIVENILKTTSGGESARTFTPLITTAIEIGVPKANMMKQAGQLFKAIKPGVDLNLGQAQKNAEAIEALIRVFGK